MKFPSNTVHRKAFDPVFVITLANTIQLRYNTITKSLLNR